MQNLSLDCYISVIQPHQEGHGTILYLMTTSTGSVIEKIHPRVP